MKGKIAKCLISWVMLILGVAAIFAYRNTCGVLATVDAQPTITQMKVNADGYVGIWWECFNTSLTSYRVYSVKDGNKTLLEIVDSRTLHYWDKEVANGEPICYQVTAANNIRPEDGILLSKPSVASSTVIVHRSKAIPANMNAAYTKVLSATESAGTLTISWEPAYNIPFDGYAVMRRGYGDTDWAQIGKIEASALEFNDDTCIPETVYEYAVVAYRGAGDDLQYGQCSNTVSAKVGGSA